MRSQQLLPLIVCAIVAFGFSCGGDGGGSSTAGGPGVLLIARPPGIVELDLASSTESMLIPAGDNGSFVLDPALSPGFDRIAYVVQPPVSIEGGVYDAGSDLWVANRDGSGARLVFEHADPSQLVRFPRWLDDDNVLAIVQEIVQEGGNARIVYELQRIPLDGSERETLLSNVLSFTIAPDEDALAYAQTAAETGESLYRSSVDATGAELLLAPDDNLAPFQSPEYAPDGDQIAFASADQTIVRAPVRLVALGPVTRPATDGLPEDIWLIDAEGGTPRMVADLKEDLPALTWNGDGTRIYVLGSSGLYDIDLGNGATNIIGEGAFHGQLDWAPARE